MKSASLIPGRELGASFDEAAPSFAASPIPLTQTLGLKVPRRHFPNLPKPVAVS